MNSVGFSSDDSRVVCGDYAKKVTVLDASSGEVVWEHALGGAVRALLTRVMPCEASVRFGWGCLERHACGCVRWRVCEDVVRVHGWLQARTAYVCKASVGHCAAE